MDNDQANTQRRIPANATVDFKLSGEYQHFFWSLSANNLLNALYYDYAIASIVHRRPLQRLSAAGPDLHGEGRRDVLSRGRRFGARSGPACPDRTRRYSPGPEGRGEYRSMPDDSAATIDLLQRAIADPDTQWSLGTFGAIAEFSRDPR